MIHVFILTDEKCSMTRVLINGEIVQECNNWDFHLGDYIQGIKDCASFTGEEVVLSSEEKPYNSWDAS